MTEILAKNEEIERFLSRIVKDQNSSGCWHLLSKDGSKFLVDFCLGQQKAKAKRFAFELFKKEKIPTDLLLLCKCNNTLCVNPDHQVIGNHKDMIKIMQARIWPYRKGIKQKPEVTEMLRKINTGKVISQEMREHLRRLNLGNKHSEETKRKMSASRVGIRVPEEARKKIAFSKQGAKNWNTKLTAEDVLKIRSLSAGESRPGKRVRRGERTIAEIAEMFKISHVHVINIRNKKVWKHVDEDDTIQEKVAKRRIAELLRLKVRE